MKTTYYTLTRWNDGAMAAGFDSAAGGERQLAAVRRTERRVRTVGEDNVIDLNAWRCANPELCREKAEDGRYWDGGEQEEPELVPPAPRARRDHRRAMCAAELAATLAVAAAALALALRVLLF